MKAINEQVKERLAVIVDGYSSQIKELPDKQNQVIEKTKEFEDKYMGAVNGFLVKNKFQLQQFDYSMTGPISGEFQPDAKLRVQLHLQPEGEFKYVPFKGYDSRGASKNSKSLDVASAKLEKKLKEQTKIESVSVNRYSLEEKNGKKSSIIVTFWV